MGAFDDLIPQGGGASKGSGEFDDLIPGKLSREQELRRENLKLLLARGEPGYTERISDQITSGVTRPITGVMRGITGVFDPTSTFGERYRAGVGAEEDYYQRSVKNTPGPLGTATDVVGSIVGAGKATGPASLGKQVLQSSVQGAVEGGARNAEDLGSAAGGAAVGGGLGAATSAVVGGLLDRLGRVKGAKADIGKASQGGTSQTLEREGSALFDKLDNAGITFGGRETPALANKANAAVANSAYSANVPPELQRVLRDINERSANGAMTYGDVRKIQTQLSDLKAHNDAGTRRLAGDVADAVDDFMNTAKPTMPAKSVGTVSPGDLAEAKDLWRRGSQASKVEGLAEAGTRRADDPTAKVAKNFENYTDKFAKNPNKYNPNTPEQMRIMDELVEGSPKTEAVAAGADKLARYLGTTSALAGAGAVAAPMLGFDSASSDKASNIALLGLGTAGALKGGSSILRQKLAEQSAAKVNNLMRNIITGSTAQAPNAYIPRNALALLLAKQDAARGAGNLAASFVNKE